MKYPTADDEFFIFPFNLQVIENAEDFQTAIFEFEAWLPKVSAAVQQFEPISSNLGGIKKQLKEAEARILNCLYLSSTYFNKSVTTVFSGY